MWLPWRRRIKPIRERGSMLHLNLCRLAGWNARAIEMKSLGLSVWVSADPGKYFSPESCLFQGGTWFFSSLSKWTSPTTNPLQFRRLQAFLFNIYYKCIWFACNNQQPTPQPTTTNYEQRQNQTLPTNRNNPKQPATGKNQADSTCRGAPTHSARSQGEDHCGGTCALRAWFSLDTWECQCWAYSGLRRRGSERIRTKHVYTNAVCHLFLHQTRNSFSAKPPEYEHMDTQHTVLYGIPWWYAGRSLSHQNASNAPRRPSWPADPTPGLFGNFCAARALFRAGMSKTRALPNSSGPTHGLRTDWVGGNFLRYPGPQIEVVIMWTSSTNLQQEANVQPSTDSSSGRTCACFTGERFKWIDEQ